MYLNISNVYCLGMIYLAANPLSKQFAATIGLGSVIVAVDI